MLVEARAEFFSWSVWILSSTFAWWQEGCIMWVICWVLRQDKCSVFRSVLESLCGNLFTPLVWLRSGDTVWRCSWCAFNLFILGVMGNWVQGLENAHHIFNTELLPPLLDFNSPISLCFSLSSPYLPHNTSPPSPSETPSPSNSAVWQRSQLGRIKLIPDSRFWFYFLSSSIWLIMKLFAGVSHITNCCITNS